MSLQDKFEKEATSNLTRQFEKHWQEKPVGNHYAPYLDRGLLEKHFKEATNPRLTRISFRLLYNLCKKAFIEKNLAKEIDEVSSNFYDKVKRLEKNATSNL